MGWPLLALDRCCWRTTIGTWRRLPAALLCLIVYFFRDPLRRIPTEPGLLVAPADGKVVEITRLAHDEFIGGPAVRIGIFLSIFNVHLNRAPAESRVIALRYSPGEFLNALNPRERAAEREHVDRPGRGIAAAPPAGRAADFRGHRPADRLRPAARRSARPRAEVRHDQARLAHRVDHSRHGRSDDRSRRSARRIQAGTTVMARYRAKAEAEGGRRKRAAIAAVSDPWLDHSSFIIHHSSFLPCVPSAPSPYFRRC